MEKQILSLNQKKEDLLADLKAAILNLHQHLQQKQQELEQEVLLVGASEENAGAEKDASEWKVGMAVVNTGPTFHKTFQLLVFLIWKTRGLYMYGL